nr:MAG TPA: Protein of unknown function (DUF1642) [Caudoviricetes sp.]
MNVKELIEKIEVLPAEDYKYRPYIDKKMVLGLVRQLDEPQKVVVPQFVADWIEECKNDDFHLFGAMEAISLNQKKWIIGLEKTITWSFSLERGLMATRKRSVI